MLNEIHNRRAYDIGRHITEEVDIQAIWNLLLHLDKKLTSHIEAEAKIQPEIDKLVNLLKASRILVVVSKYIISVTTAIALASAWVYDRLHWKS